ncbi:hypothetical protein VP01_6774g1 [Puccinia sorghi]|uniref:Uncharacterized protein n=1 Tax=Puccinia sorghi TaxID=27349 RepID=A0A0L6UEJ9_9BASI|nr:hypothetical protein VP01_6774g1 [Puccinia sorghi]
MDTLRNPHGGSIFFFRVKITPRHLSEDLWGLLYLAILSLNRAAYMKRTSNSWSNLCATSQLFSWTKFVSTCKIIVALFSASQASRKNFLAAKYCVIDEMADMPAKFLVFTPVAQYIIEANAAWYSIIPGISYFGVLAVTVTEATVKSNLCQTQALVHNLDPSWTIHLTFHDVVSTC